jgi:hypothetical protein
VRLVPDAFQQEQQGCLYLLEVAFGERAGLAKGLHATSC